MGFNIVDRQESLTVFTDVEYFFPDGNVEVIKVAHFEPSSEDDIIKNIQNRYESELVIRNLK